MSIAHRIPVAKALLARSRNVLEAGVRTPLLDLGRIVPPKPATARDGAAPVQRHGGR